MVGENRAATTARISSMIIPQLTRPVYVDIGQAVKDGIDMYYKARGAQERYNEQERMKGLKQNLADAVESGDETSINNAYAQLDPAGYVDYLNRIKANREASDLEFARKKELLDIQNQNAMGLERLKDALGGTLTSAARNYEYLKQQGLSDNESMAVAFGGNTEAVGGALASGTLSGKGINAYEAEKGKQLAQQEAKQAENIQQFSGSMENIKELQNQIRKDPSVFGFASPLKVASSRLSAEFGSQEAKDFLRNRGNAYRQLGNIKNDLIAKAKASGQSGINTAKEIEQATAGLNENSSPEEILGALDAMYKSASRLVNSQKPRDIGYYKQKYGV